ncbi:MULTISPECIES: tripartite tricarboxylate transporter substrate binding protein [unclassified Polaromonas]|uniref:Bug family tripartite tricarboxylate transporter substrate binding protein n=1 Tax=unclassified Polaromonas TaxID=2638319 RepID=UPI0018CA238A|nr:MULTISPECIES: tripartite tricarboxylate transporter substrate binding protein [unclassified Polaromonas]MBG6072741.1 tripartite-type tricarboxylate transporter receptor subunit TctC [Polaromonas sp. CG_9.7]MBG6114745.1 tripartite-type tricarboxylate transporter receptor subunit TctC [Polaromonas sp. CG_9.2]MDH6184592.1 tripartite-type tricarboxylate transporter receptor subunit TctC [Polaromonas sp. CG_23.6]
MRFLSNCLRLLGAASLIAASSSAQAQTWPERPVRLVVPFPAGGATDLVARVIAQRVSKDLGQQFIVDNKSGAGGTIGTAEAAKAVADGYTLLLTTSSTHAISPHLMPRLPYDAVKDFTPVAHLADAASVVLVTPSLPVKTVAELIDYAKKHPGQLNYASSGNGTIVHLTTEAFKAQAGVFITHVPYKGTALAIPDVIAGSVQVLIDAIPSGMPHVRSGRLRALAVTGDKRSTLAPELPTVAEAGLPGFSSITWFGLYAPRNLKPDLLARVHEAFEKASHAPDVVESLAKLGVEPAPLGSPAQFAAMVSADSQRWARIIRDRNIKLE